MMAEAEDGYPWVALGVSVLVFFACLLAVDRLVAVRTSLTSPERGFSKQVVRRFTVAG
jgi:hypothetical protein